MPAVSDLLPSPGAPVTVGMTARTGPSRVMLPVVPVLADLFAAAIRLPGSAPAGWAPPAEGCDATLDATGAWALCEGSQAMKELAALPAIDWATCGVNAAQGSLPV